MACQHQNALVVSCGGGGVSPVQRMNPIAVISVRDLGFVLLPQQTIGDIVIVHRVGPSQNVNEAML